MQKDRRINKLVKSPHTGYDWHIWGLCYLVYSKFEMRRRRMMLRKGSRGTEVKKLQEQLNKLGYNCGKVDGIFGSRTESAVKAFQKDNGLVVDGIVGPKT